MSSMKSFDYLEPTSTAEVCELLARFDDSARVIAGGTDLLVAMKRRSLNPLKLISLSKVQGLKTIEYIPGLGLRIGALVSISDIQFSPIIKEKVPVLAHAAAKVGSQAIRNMATIGGNLCNAAPSADMAPPLLVLSAQALCSGLTGDRRIILEKFFTGPGRTSLTKGEFLAGIEVPETSSSRLCSFVKVGRTAVDIALVNTAVAATFEYPRRCLTGVRIALGAVGPVPFRSVKAEVLAEGRSIAADGWIDETGMAAAEEAQPINDVRASADYRRAMVKLLVRDAFRNVIAQAILPQDER